MRGPSHFPCLGALETWWGPLESRMLPLGPLDHLRRRPRFLQAIRGFPVAHRLPAASSGCTLVAGYETRGCSVTAGRPSRSDPTPWPPQRALAGSLRSNAQARAPTASFGRTPRQREAIAPHGRCGSAMLVSAFRATPDPGPNWDGRPALSIGAMLGLLVIALGIAIDGELATGRPALAHRARALHRRTSWPSFLGCPTIRPPVAAKSVRWPHMGRRCFRAQR